MSHTFLNFRFLTINELENVDEDEALKKIDVTVRFASEQDI
jgi:hypothetical protein